MSTNSPIENLDEGAELASKSDGRGGLVVVATPIGNIGDISKRAIEALTDADLVCCEDTRHSGQLFKRLGIHVKQLISLHTHNETQRSTEVVRRVREGQTVVLISDAGTPLISDPGERVVASVLAEGLPVTTVPGPSAVIAALSISGLSLDRWCFEGFLPRKGMERRERMQHIAHSSAASVIYESPLRVEQTLNDLEECCGRSRHVVIARELTKLHEEIWRGSLGDALQRELVVPRGEYVIIIAPGEQGRLADEVKIKGALEQLFAAGLDRRDAVTALEVLLDVPHRIAYQMALEVGPPRK